MNKLILVSTLGSSVAYFASLANWTEEKKDAKRLTKSQADHEIWWRSDENRAHDLSIERVEE